MECVSILRDGQNTVKICDYQKPMVLYIKPMCKPLVAVKAL